MSVVTTEQVGVVVENDPSEDEHETEEGLGLDSVLNIASKIAALAEVLVSVVSVTVYVADAEATILEA